MRPPLFRPLHPATAAPLLSACLLAGLLGCEGADSARPKVIGGSDTGASGADAGPDAGCPAGALALPRGCDEPWLCPDAWHRPDAGYGCVPDPLPTDCPEGSLAVPGLGCTPAWVCPEGWHRLEGTIGCEPPPLPSECPEGSFATPLGCTAPWVCPAGWARVPGELHCEPHAGDCLGDTHPTADGGCAPVEQRACGAGRFGAGPWSEGTVFVDPEAPVAGADGSAAHPYPALATALADGHARTIALSQGRHELSGSLTRPVALAGACAEGTTLVGSFTVRRTGALELADLTFEGSAGEPFGIAVVGTLSVNRGRFRGGDAPLVQVQGPGTATLAGVEFGPSGGMALVAVHGGVVSLDRAVVHEATHVALWAQDPDTRLEVEETTVRDTALLAGEVSSGFGVSALSGARIGLRDVQVLESGLTGVLAADGAGAALERLVVRGTRDTSGTGGGLVGLDAATLTGTDVVISDVDSTGLFASRGVTATFDRLAVGRTRRNPDADKGGQGVVLRHDTALILAGAEIRRAGDGGLMAFDGSTATLRETWLADTQTAENDFTPAVVLSESAGVFERVAVTRFGASGIQVFGANASLHGTGVQVDAPTSGAFQVAGLFASEGAALTLVDSEITRVFERGVEVTDGATVRLERVAVRSVSRLPGSPPPNGSGLFAFEAGRLELSDVLLEDVVGGLVLQGPDALGPDAAPYTLQRVAVRGVARSPTTMPGAPAAGLWALQATVKAEALSVTDFAEIGILATARTLLDLKTIELQARAADGPYVSGLGAIHGATLSVEGALVSGVEGPAVIVQGDETSFTARGLAVEDTGSEAFPGAGLYLGPGAIDADLEDVSVRRTDGTALIAEGGAVRGRRIELADSIRPSGRDGRGLWFDTEAQVSLTDLAITDAAAIGLILVGAGTRGDFEGLTVTGTGHAPTSPEAGAAVGVLQGASLRVRRAAIVDSASRGLVASTAEVNFASARIDGSGADGVLVDGGTVDLEAFSVDGSREAGISSTNARVTLRNGTVTHNRVGVQFELDGKPEMTDTVVEANAEAEVQCSTACVDTPAAPPPPPRFTSGE